MRRAWQDYQAQLRESEPTDEISTQQSVQTYDTLHCAVRYI